MRERSADEIRIREYLLGNIPEENCGEIETKLLTDTEFEKLADLIEEDIIEDYLDGNLSYDEKDAVESRFLRPPERKRKLWFIRLLRSQAPPEPPEPRRWVPSHLTNRQMQASLAALVLISMALGIYNLALRRDLRSRSDSLANTTQQLDQLQKELSALRNQSTTGQGDTYVALSLVSGAVRGSGNIPEVRFGAGKTGLQIHVLPIGNAVIYKAAIEQSDGTQVWFSNNLKVAPSGAELVILVSNTLPPGHYSLLLSPGNSPATKREYPFTVVE